MATHLLASNMDLPHDMEGWGVPVSEIRDWAYTLIDIFGFLGSITAIRNRAMETLLNEREAMMLAYEGEVLNWRAYWEQNNHVAVTKLVTAWRSAITVAQRHVPPVHPFNSGQCLLVILNNMPYIPPDAPDNAPTLDPCDYDWWFLLTLRKPRYDDKKALKECNVR
ncbi:hypothetical protein ARMGADRAFT_1032502 [Armillaria gallica]|uniref:Uncharacterized protein n=1 Tax=Armillaria gallica TaxID=47427 RepID=A0A2H3D5H0_ARMGA|nr:hypothetical protein ARMGADRAFT_1032502 [Armillaria gallica]